MNATFTDTAVRPAAWTLEIRGEAQDTEYTTWGRAERALRAATALHGASARLLPVWTYSTDEAASGYWNRAAWSETDLFHHELDGETFASLRDLEDYRWYRMEADAEAGWLRAAETSDVYRWEEEQDRARAAYGF